MTVEMARAIPADIIPGTVIHLEAEYYVHESMRDVAVAQAAENQAIRAVKAVLDRCVDVKAAIDGYKTIKLDAYLMSPEDLENMISRAINYGASRLKLRSPGVNQ